MLGDEGDLFFDAADGIRSSACKLLDENRSSLGNLEGKKGSCKVVNSVFKIQAMIDESRKMIQTKLV